MSYRLVDANALIGKACCTELMQNIINTMPAIYIDEEPNNQYITDFTAHKLTTMSVELVKPEILKIDMDNGTRYTFDSYDNYYIDNSNLVIKCGDQWIGCFSLNHMIGFFVDK